jgi:hypothetical protein
MKRRYIHIAAKDGLLDAILYYKYDQVEPPFRVLNV